MTDNRGGLLMTTTCDHTEHAVRGRERVGRYFRGLNDSEGTWEPCFDNEEKEFVIQSWDTLLGSQVARRESDAEVALKDLLERVAPRWVRHMRTPREWVYAGWFDLQSGRHERWVYIHFNSEGLITRWRLAGAGVAQSGWREGAAGLARTLIEEKA